MAYKHNGEDVFVVDSHVHLWDASEANWRPDARVYADGWIRCFYDYHKNLSPAEWVWPLPKYQKYTEQDMMKDLFEEGYVDRAIFLPTALKDWYVDGFNTVERDAVLAEKYPDRFILNSRWDPRDGEAGLYKLEQDHKRWGIKGV